MSTNDSFNPGGQLSVPSPSAEPLLDLTVRPRMSLYLASETSGEFIVDAAISNLVGQPMNISNAITSQTADGSKANTLSISITVSSTGQKLVSGASIPINTTSNQIPFKLVNLSPQMEPFAITLTAISADGTMAHTAKTQLSFLPLRTDGGSVAKVDSLFHGMLVQPYNTNSSEFVPIFPYSFYASTDFLVNNSANVAFYANAGYNIVHLIPNGASDPTQSFGTLAEFESFLDDVEANGMFVMYDMRWTYKNLSAVAETARLFGNRKSMLLWYTADEPDGQVDPLNATSLAYNTLKAIDPYHPVSLVLNCFNYFYEEYTAGADIILSDVYPIGNNLTHSTEWDTVCNSTYGDCGCDDCNDVGGFSDISIRLDNFNNFDRFLGRAGTKPKWGVPQAFGDSQYWLRNPTAEEETVMNVLSVNHGAKGIVMWDYPTTDEIANETSALSKVLARQPAVSFLTGAETIMDIPWDVKGAPLVNGLDVAAWSVDGKNQMLVSIINMDYSDLNGTTVSVTLPQKVKSVSSALWGSAKWQVVGNGSTISRVGMKGLEVDLVIFDT